MMRAKSAGRWSRVLPVVIAACWNRPMDVGEKETGRPPEHLHEVGGMEDLGLGAYATHVK